MTNYAQIESRTAYLSTDFGEQLARKWFGDEFIDSLPRYTRGPRKDKIKGAITWSKVVRGGWVRGSRETANSEATGYVETRVGRIFDRKLHELVSDRFGTSVGRAIRDLEAEEAQAKYQKIIQAELDEQIRKLDMERSRLEEVILSGEVDENIKIFQDIVSNWNNKLEKLIEKLR